MNSVITFDNLRQANSEVIGQTQPVKAAWTQPERFSRHLNAMGMLYQPENLDDVSNRACEAGAKFRAMFQESPATI